MLLVFEICEFLVFPGIEAILFPHKSIHVTRDQVTGRDEGLISYEDIDND